MSSKDLSFTETFGCTPVAGDPLPLNPNNVEPYVWRFICAVYPSAPNLALASFSEEKALTDAADEIERLKRERAEMVCGHQNAEHAMLDNLAEARASIDRLQRELDNRVSPEIYRALRVDMRLLREERDRLRDFVNGLLGLVQLIDMRDDLPREIGEAMSNNHRYLDALHYMNGLPPPRHAVETDAGTT